MAGDPNDSDFPTDIDVVPESELSAAEELPVVARLVVEIRSDGSRTIARGALEDRQTGQNVAIEAHGASPMSLAFALARSMLKVPSLSRRAARALLPGARRRKKR